VPIDDDRWIAVLACLELSVDRGNFTAIFLLNNEGSVVQKEAPANLILDFESLRAILLRTIKINPEFSEVVLYFPGQTIVMQPLKLMVWKGVSAEIPDVAYLIAVLAPTRTFRKALNELVRNLFEPFKMSTKKEAPKKDEMDSEMKRRLAEQVLKDLDEL
jgi:hypothetical protein